MGRFISADQAKQGMNWYEYCGANPVRYVDPTGLSWWSSVCKAVSNAYSSVIKAVSSASKTVSKTVYYIYKPGPQSNIKEL